MRRLATCSLPIAAGLLHHASEVNDVPKCLKALIDFGFSQAPQLSETECLNTE
jgi:hypothetical protein